MSTEAAPTADAEAQPPSPGEEKEQATPPEAQPMSEAPPVDGEALARELAAQRVAQLRAAAEATSAAAEQLQQASKEAAKVSSPGRTLFNAALWGVGVFLVGWGLNKLADMATAQPALRPRPFPTGTEEAHTEPAAGRDPEQRA